MAQRHSHGTLREAFGVIIYCCNRICVCQIEVCDNKRFAAIKVGFATSLGKSDCIMFTQALSRGVARLIHLRLVGYTRELASAKHILQVSWIG